MARRRATREYRCKRCGEVFTSMVRLMHHRAAERALRTMRDIRTTRDVPHSAGTNR